MIQTEKVSPSPNIIARQVGEETVLLDLESGTYFGLDAIGAHIWQLIEEGRSIPDIVTAILEGYDVERPQVEDDVARLVSELHDKKLVTAG